MTTAKQVTSAKKASDKAFTSYTKKRQKYIKVKNTFRKQQAKKRK
jgi:hypothetical protein